MLFTCAQWVIVDALVPPSLHLALPNLRSIAQQQCTLSSAAATAQLDSECSSIQHLTVSMRAQAAALPAQLAQLPSFRGLTSLTLHTTATSTAFLPSLSSQLTALELDSGFRDYSFQTQRPTADWAATLQRVAQCTRLRSLALPATTVEELRPLATALPQLRCLYLNYDFTDERVDSLSLELDGDAMVEVLLGLTQLTSLSWEETWPYVVRRSHADRPCGWRELYLGGVGVQQLLHLPLRSLTSPVTLRTLDIVPRDGVADVQRFVSALAGEGAPGVAWQQSERIVQFNSWFPTPDLFVHGAAPADTPAALLRALQPLLAGAVEVRVENVEWDAEAVRELPQSCRKLSVRDGEVPLVAMVEMARHLRRLESVLLELIYVEPLAVVGYAVAEEGERRLAREVAVHAGGAAGEEQGSRRVRVEVQCYDDDVDHREQPQSAVRALGLDWLDLSVHA